MKKIRIHCFQHVDFEGLAHIESWIEQNNHQVGYTKFFEPNYSLPSIGDYDWLIVMGGPMGVYDEEKYDWLKEEKQAIKQAINETKTVLGICLGSQLIAEVLGAKIYKNEEKEIGWLDIQLNTESALGAKNETFTVFHWHGDTYDLPENSILLASSEACKNQAFSYKDKVIGLQFHLEITNESLSTILTVGKDELTEGKYIQKEDFILKKLELASRNNRIMDQLLNHLSTFLKEHINQD